MIERIPQPLLAAGRLALLVAAYSTVLFVSLYLSFLLRFDFEVPDVFWPRFWLSVAWIIPLKLGLLALFGQFRTLLSFFSLPDAKMIALAMLCAAFVELGAWIAVEGMTVIPRGVIATDLVVSFLGLAGLRTALRIFRERFITALAKSASIYRRTAIIGTGDSAAFLLRDIQNRPGLGLEVVCLIGEEPASVGSTLHGTAVLGPRSRLPQLAKSLGLQKVIIALPEAGPALIREIVGELNELGLDHDILPSTAQLLSRQVTVSHLRRVDPVDLLGREEVSLDVEGIARMLRGSVVMVTGAGGSIGGELCRQVAVHEPARIILVERSEPALFAIEQELRKFHPHVKIVPRVSDVCDETAMERLFGTHVPSLVFHSAAHKHVPLMEEQPAEAFANNVLGTEIVARLAGRHGARKFVLVSSDKAVNPANVMGATKRLAEMVVDEIRRAPGNTCAYCAVRFGNVLGSSGSVVPIFRQQIAEGGPVTVTHPEVRRFFMSLPEAAGLILQSARQAGGGEVFVLDMGEPMKIEDLARQMIELSGFVPDKDIKITYIGLRPGEKLHEEPIHEMENVEATDHPKVRVVRTPRQDCPVTLVGDLRSVARGMMGDPVRVRTWLADRIPEYNIRHDGWN